MPDNDVQNQDIQQQTPPPKSALKKHFFLQLDSWIDFHPLECRFPCRRDLGGCHHLFRAVPRARLERLVVEILGEGMTWGTVGAVLMLALALPAFEETQKDWRNHGDFAVTFLDRYGNVIGHRGINP